MKIELTIAGKVVVVEADGPVSVSVRDVEVAVSAPVSVAAAPEEKAPVAPPSVAAVPRPPVGGGDLFARLCGLRRQLAAEKGVPPYVVFHDKSLREMADNMPQDLAEFGKIGGVGQAKIEKYGARFLAVIQGAAAG